MEYLDIFLTKNSDNWNSFYLRATPVRKLKFPTLLFQNINATIPCHIHLYLAQECLLNLF